MDQMAGGLVRETSEAAVWRRATRQVHGGTQRSEFGETSEAMFLTSGYVYQSPEEAEDRFKGDDDGFIYSRFSNPTVGMFEERLALAEGAPRCLATATGMAAVNAALMCQLEAGDRVVASRALFGSCCYILDEILPRFAITVVLVDGSDLEQWRQAFRQPTKCVFLETPSNPTLQIIDLEAVCEMAHAAGAQVIVDNVFATPVLQRPREFGADIVVYSATKHIDGQGRCLGGAVLGDEDFCENVLKPYLRHTGPALSPFNAWVMLKGLETLELRVARHAANAAEIADFLSGQGGIEGVLYPTRHDHPQAALARRQMSAGGSVVAFDVAGGKERAFDFLRRLRLVKISNNLGDAKSLITHPATTTHQRLEAAERRHLGISDRLVRLSVGLEDAEDVKQDLLQALV